MSEARFHDKVCIITGAATGIGKACALRFASEGARVVIDYVGDPARARGVVDAAERAGGTALAVEADVSDAGDVDRLVDETVAQFGGVDVLVNNAGIEEKHPLVDTPLGVWDKVLDVDLRGPWLCMQAVVRKMIARGRGGRIINISSVHEDLPMPHNIPYCAAKGGLRMLARTTCEELAPYGITVNNVAPGAIDTPIDASVESDPEQMRSLLAEIPMGRMGRPEEVAGLCAWLASDEAAYVTGSTYVIDGGLMRHAKSL